MHCGVSLFGNFGGGSVFDNGMGCSNGASEVVQLNYFPRLHLPGRLRWLNHGTVATPAAVVRLPVRVIAVVSITGQ